MWVVSLKKYPTLVGRKKIVVNFRKEPKPVFEQRKKVISSLSLFFRSGVPLWIALSVCLSVFLSVGMYVYHFFWNPYFYNLYISQIYLLNKNLLNKKIWTFCLNIFFKRCLCSYINFEFLYFISISAKIYILQIYL